MQYAIRNIHAYEAISSLELSSVVTSHCREITDSSLDRNATLLSEKDTLLHINDILSQEKDALVTAHKEALVEKTEASIALNTAIKTKEEEISRLRAEMVRDQISALQSPLTSAQANLQQDHKVHDTACGTIDYLLGISEITGRS